MRYAGQFHDIEIPVPAPLPRDSARDLRARFDGEYAKLYGVTLDGYPVQALNWRVLVAADAPQVSIRVPGRAGDGAAPGRRRALFLPGGRGFVDAPVYRRYDLAGGVVITGPAVVEEAEATTLLWPGDTLTVDAGQNLVITIGPPEAANP
jgi:5-oxoprolinase (ATP-hydrolysing)/N-methylhydantoinase A